MNSCKDVRILRDLARRYAEIAADPIQDERRNLWRDHNSFVRTRILILILDWPCAHEIPEIANLECEDPFYRAHEYNLRVKLFHASCGDDAIQEPWITQRASVVEPEGLWGLPIGRIPSTVQGGSWKFDPAIKNLEDAGKMLVPEHIIDEEDTARNVARLQDVVGDILEVNVDRAPAWTIWGADISTYLSYLRGLDQLMWDMVDNPGWLHEVLSFMRDGILKVHEEAERAGDWQLCNSYNQAMPYCHELPDPKANSGPVTRDKLWIFMAAQEFTLISPEMHYEFMLQYQMPIIEKFGLSAYGCCEDLTNKIDMLRRIPNLRRIAVTPVANVRRCAEQIGTDYILSYRPNPAEMVCCGFDPDHIRRTISRALEDARGCFVDITLKDASTVENQPWRLKEWVRIVREVADRYC
ncbi:MAG: hypothetical protein ACUVRS_06175 [Armatimonadota bacterium]